MCLCGVGSGLAASPAMNSLQGTVVRVTDGDSLWLEPSPPGAPVELRLQDIDAPEICQPWGPEAKRALQDLVLNKAVSVRVSGRDTHGRTLGTLYLDSLNVNKTLVQDGHAWSSRYKYDRGPYVADERMAKALSRGFNTDAGAVMPRDFAPMDRARARTRSTRWHRPRRCHRRQRPRRSSRPSRWRCLRPPPPRPTAATAAPIVRRCARARKPRTS